MKSLRILKKQLNCYNFFSFRQYSLINLFVGIWLSLEPTITAKATALELQNSNKVSYVRHHLDGHLDAGHKPPKIDAWLLAMSTRLAKFIKDIDFRIDLLRHVHFEASKVHLEPELILAIIQTESSFDQYAVSAAGAQGLMQVMPFWKNSIGSSQDNLTSIKTNLRYGCTILSHYMEKENGHLTRALARYNGSLGEKWYPERVLTNWEKYWR